MVKNPIALNVCKESWWIYEQRKIIAVQQGTIPAVTAITKQADNRNRVSENQN